MVKTSEHRSCAWLAKKWLGCKTGKKLFKRTDLLQQNHYVFEWNPSKYKNKNNPGVGPSPGRVVKNPTGESVEVAWSDGSVETMEMSDLRVAPSQNKRFGGASGNDFAVKDLHCDPTPGKTGKTGVRMIFRAEPAKDPPPPAKDPPPPSSEPEKDAEAKDVLLCCQCGHPTSGMHSCPACKKNFHTICLLSFNEGINKMCVACWTKGVNVLQTATWKPDTHDHDPFDDGLRPYDMFTQSYFKKYDEQIKKKMEEKRPKVQKKKSKRHQENVNVQEQPGNVAGNLPCQRKWAVP